MKPRRTWFLFCLALSAVAVLLTLLSLQWRPVVQHLRLGEKAELIGEWEIVEIRAPYSRVSEVNRVPFADRWSGHRAVFSVQWEGVLTPRLHVRFSPAGPLEPIRFENDILFLSSNAHGFALDGDRLTVETPSLTRVFQRVESGEESP